VTIPGPVAPSAVNHQVGIVDPFAPKDGTNYYWPWPEPHECPFVDGCVTDTGGAKPYPNNEKCVSHRFNGKQIRIVEFETEKGYDVLTVNGTMFSGKEGAGLDSATLNGMTVDDRGIRFESDFSQTAKGFKICEM